MSNKNLRVITFISVSLAIMILISSCSSLPDGSERGATPSPVPSQPINPMSDEEATQLMYELISSDEGQTQAAINRILDLMDSRFVPVFIELIRGHQLGIVYAPGTSYALEILSGEAFGYWPDWVEWYGRSALRPPLGFIGWKGTLLAKIDPRFADFLRDDIPSAIRVEEIQWDGVLVDGIPALDNPKMIPGNKEDYLKSDEPIFGIAINGDARVLPFDDNTFNGIFTNGSLHEWAQPAKIFNEIYRVLKPGGIYFISDLRRDMNLLVQWFMRLVTKPKEIRPGLISSINASYTLEEIAAILEESELKGNILNKDIMSLVIVGEKAGK